MNLKEDFSLVLSGGSALGIAHVGVLRFLQEYKYKPTEVIGTSMGALIAAAYARGLTYDGVEAVFDEMNLLKLFKFNLLKGTSLISIDKIKQFLLDKFGDISFNDLPIDLKVVATNVETGEKTVFDKTKNVSVIDALCASFAIPSIFEPYVIDGVSYWDGFLSSNLPVECATKKQILGIDVLNAHLLKTADSKKIASAIDRSFLISIINQTRDKMPEESPRCRTIDIDVSAFQKYDFHKWKELSELGYEECKKKI